MLRRSAKLGSKRKPQKEFDISFGGLHKMNEGEKKDITWIDSSLVMDNKIIYSLSVTYFSKLSCYSSQ